MSFLPSFLPSFLIVIFVVFIELPSFAQELKAIEVTDVTGVIHRIDNPYIDFIGYYRYYTMNRYLQIFTCKDPIKCMWIYPSQILIAKFRTIDGELEATITLENGDSIKGIFRDPYKTKILGNKSITFDQIKTINFIEFSHTIDGKEFVLDRASASRIWQEGRTDTPIWSIIENGIKRNVIYVQLFDSYDSNKANGYIYFFRTFRYAKTYPFSYDYDISAWLQWDAPELDIQMSDIKAITITGNLLQNNHPEVQITLTNQKTENAELLMLTWNSGYGTEEYGDFDDEDMLLFSTVYGYEGVSLSPRRKITIERYDPTSSAVNYSLYQ